MARATCGGSLARRCPGAQLRQEQERKAVSRMRIDGGRTRLKAPQMLGLPNRVVGALPPRREDSLAYTEHSTLRASRWGWLQQLWRRGMGQNTRTHCYKWA